MTDLTIYIPTIGRATEEQQATLRYLADTRYGEEGRVVLVAHADEVAALSTLRHDTVVMECPMQGGDGTLKGLGPTRQWILDNHDVEAMGPHIIMADDDLQFFARRFDEQSKFRRLEGAAEHEELFDRLDQMLHTVPVVGLADRSGANRLAPPVVMTTRMFALIGVNVPIARRIGARFDRVPLQEDFDFILQHLTLGMPNAVLTTHCKDDERSNAPGGCSTYRNPERMSASANKLHSLFPDVVKVVEKETPSWGNGMTTRTDVNVQWKKALKRGTEDAALVGLEPFPEPDWSGLAPEWEVL